VTPRPPDARYLMNMNPLRVKYRKISACQSGALLRRLALRRALSVGAASEMAILLNRREPSQRLNHIGHAAPCWWVICFLVHSSAPRARRAGWPETRTSRDAIAMRCAAFAKLHVNVLAPVDSAQAADALE
jgi:hypothetical protein